MDYKKNMEGHVTRCLECGDVIEYGRIDKKFCNESCRTRHHYAMIRAERKIRMKVMACLEKNHIFLNSLIEAGTKSVLIIEAVASGFNPTFYTSMRKTGCHCEYYCFDIVYRMTPQRLTIVSKIKNVSVSLSVVNEENIL